MNLAWVAAISVFVLAEKVLLRGELVGKLGGVVFVVTGLVMLA